MSSSIVCDCSGCPARSLAPRAAETAALVLERLSAALEQADVASLTFREAMAMMEVCVRVERIARGVDPPELFFVPTDLLLPRGAGS